MIKTKFFQTCIGLSIVLLSLGFFINSIHPATATPTPEKFFQTGSSQIGKYSICAAYNPDTYVETQRAIAIILDTESGRAQSYRLKGHLWEKYSLVTSGAD